jgi:hypothetical protein
MTKRLRLLLVLVGAFALASPVLAQSTNDTKPTASPLVRLLQSKGILTDAEVAMVSQASSPSEADARLAKLLLSKGLISQDDYNQTVGASMQQVAADSSSGARMVPAVLRVPIGASPNAAGPPASAPSAPAAEAPKVIPAVAPIRVFGAGPPKKEGVIPAFKLGKVSVAPYGYFKASVVYDSNNQQGNDFPLPGFFGDTGPTRVGEFHLKARNLRIGSNFEWLDPSPNLAVTARLEFDFEGDFTRVNNRNISSVRSSQPSLRLAWARLDYKFSDRASFFSLFGQDWTPFASSTLPNLVEGTGVGLGYGTLYERAPQARFGFNFKAGGSRDLQFQPEFALVLPAFGNLPGPTPPGAPTGLDNQLGFGERQGVDSARPEFQSRFVTQFQLDKAPGVAPAQLIVSGMYGKRVVVVNTAGVPGAFLTAFPNGARLPSVRFGVTGEVQLPTRYATLIAKWYNGSDLRFYFNGQLLSEFNDTLGLAGTANGTALDGTRVIFGTGPSGPTVAPQLPFRATGGFANVAFPLSRIFGANPEGRNAGWQLSLHYGIDEVKARDMRRNVAITGAGSRLKSDLGAVTLLYKLNTWVTFGAEESLYRTRALTGLGLNGLPVPLPLYRGLPSREVHNVRTEVATIFTF